MNKEAFRNVIGISFAHKLSHIGSNLSALPIIEEIYDQTTKAPLSGMINNPALENKQVNLMIGIAKKQAKGTR